MPSRTDLAAKAVGESLGSCLWALVALGLWPFTLLFRGFTAHCLWGWFVTPALGVASPGTWFFTGALCLVIVAFLETDTRKKKQFPMTRVLSQAFLTLAVLGAGYLLYLL